MRCYVCDKENWKKLHGLHTKALMQICKACGTLCHEVEAKREAEMLEYYRKDYRKKPTVENLVTTTNKLQYLIPLAQAALGNKQKAICGDVGAATGYFLNYLASQGHRVAGSEYTIGFRRMSQNFYGIPLCEELPTKHKYDLICIYHVLEHMVEPDKKLLKYKEMLTPDGKLIVATPFWLDCLEEQSGVALKWHNKPSAQDSFDNLFHKDHINLFTRRNLQNLFKKVGLTVVKDDFTSYGQSYILKAGQPEAIQEEDVQDVMAKLQAQREAIKLHYQGDNARAVRIWPNFPEAHIIQIFQQHAKDPQRQHDMLSQVPGEIRGHWRFLFAEASWLAQYEKLDEALKLFYKIMETKPHPEAIFKIGEMLTRLKRHKEAIMAFQKVATLHPQKWRECYAMALHNACEMPTWDEEAIAEIKERVFTEGKNKGAIRLNPPGGGLVQAQGGPAQGK